MNWRLDETIDHRTVAIHHQGITQISDGATVTGLADLDTHSPRQLEITVTTADREVLTLPAEVVHGYTLSLLEPNMNVNGAALGEDDPLLVAHSTVRVTWPDGEVGYGNVERDYRRSMLPSPETR